VISLISIVVINRYIYKGSSVAYKRTRPNFDISTEGVRKVVLENGMTLLIYKNPAVPKVLIQIAYNIGSYVEEGGEKGLAHLIEHMIFKGTQKLSESDIDQISRKYGATFNAFTSMDVTSYYFETNKNNWKPFVEILADCMQNARFEQEHLASELKAVIQELKMYRDNYWSMMFERMNMALFPANHPYHYPIIGFKQDLMNLQSENLKQFYKKYYTPDRATLFIVGDVDDAEVEALVRKHFESITSDHKAQVHEFPTITDDIMTHHIKMYENVNNEQLGFFWAIPGDKDKQELLSSAAAFLLGGGEGSRLQRLLVDDLQIATSISVYAQKFMESGIFLILIEPVEGKAEDCKKAIQDELVNIAKSGFSDKELEHMTRTEGKHFFQRLQNYRNFTYEWLTSFFATGDELAIFHRANQYVDVQSEHVQKFIKEFLEPKLVNQIEVLPLPQEMKAESEQRKQASDELDKKILQKYVRTAPIEQPKMALTVSEAKQLDFVFPKPDRTFTLDNGLTVLLKQNRTLPIMYLNCKFKDFYYLSNAQEGILLELMMNNLIEGSQDYTKKENVDFFEFHGADFRFGGNGAVLSMLSADYEKVIERFVHVLMQPTFPEKGFDISRKISIDSFERSKDEASDVAIRELKSLIYKDHPFSWRFDDAIKDIQSSSTEMLKTIHSKYINPENVLLTLVGDFDLDHMQQTITKYFGDWKSGERLQISESKINFDANIHNDIKLIRDQVVMFFGKPSKLTMYDEDLIPIKLLNYIAFYSLGSRIYTLRERTGLFYNAFGAWAAGAAKTIGFNYLGAILSPDKLEFAEREMKKLIQDIGENGVAEHELDAARQLYLKSLIDGVSNNANVSDLLATLQAFELGFDYYDNVLKRVQTMDLKEINEISKKYFSTQDMVRVRVGRINEG